MCIIDGSDELLQKRADLWKYIKETDERLYKKLRHGIIGTVMNLPGKFGRKIAVGDQILFNNNENNDTILVNVVNLHICSGFADIYSKFDKVSLGYKPDEPAHPDDMLDYYPQEEQNNFGVVGIEIELVK